MSLTHFDGDYADATGRVWTPDDSPSITSSAAVGTGALAASVNGDLRKGGILHAVWPSPDHLSDPQLRQVLGLHLGQQDDVAVRDDLVTCLDSADQLGQCIISGAELLAVAVLKKDPLP